MAYAAGDLILHDHYNVFATGNADGSANNAVANINTVWGTGTGAIGYGQPTTITGVAAGDVVTATQWATLIGRLNSVLTHQSGAGSGITLPTAGATVAYIAALSGGITTAFNNKANYASNGATVTGTNFTAAISSTTGVNQSIYRSVTFPSTQAARYFFNAGGYLNYYTSVTGGTGSAANNSLTNMVNAIGGLTGFRNTANNGRTGSGLTLNVNNTAFGYRNLLLNAGTNVIYVTDTAAAYTADNAQLIIWTNNNDATSGANGPTVIFEIHLNVGDHSWDDSISCTVNTRVDVVYPETTNLPASPWGTPTIS
jgi:hypothetical protein